MFIRNNKAYAFITLGFLVFLSACGPRPSLENAKIEYDLMRFSNAAEMLEEVYQDVPREKRDSVAYVLAKSYEQMLDFQRASRWYQRAIRLEYPRPEVYLEYGKLLMMMEDYEDAIVNFQEYKRRVPGDGKADNFIANARKAVELKDKRTRWHAESFRAANSGQNDFAPVLANNDRSLYFTSDRADAEGRTIYGWTGLDHTSLFVIEQGRGRREGRWERPQLLEGPVNSNYNDGVATFNSRGNIMYYTQCNGPRGDLTNCRILMSNQRGRAWGDPEVLPFCDDSTVNYGHPTMSPDDSRMYFSSDMEGGYGEFDIYFVDYVRRGRTWSDPVNLGPVINSEGREMFPYLKNDTTLYFSSNGHEGMGGLDIFVSYGRGTEWTEPENLGPPFNSGGDDFSITFTQDGESGFFSTNRPGTRGDEIWRFYLEPLEFTLSGIVYDAKTSEPLQNATVILQSNISDEDLTFVTDETGFYEFELEEEAHYEFHGEKEEYFNSPDELLSTVGEDFSYDFNRDLYLQPFPDPEELIAIKGIYYDLDKYFIREDAKPALDSLANILMQYPDLRIELGSHTDCRADSMYNIRLAQNRAESAVDYLVEQGVSRERLVPRGYGQNNPEIECACPDNNFTRQCTEEEHQLNRRTTFSILREGEG